MNPRCETHVVILPLSPLFKPKFNMRFSLINVIHHKNYSGSCRGVRVRFAPSPTGSLHLGGLRTALYNYLFARQNNGAFILRIEDTDQTRVVPGSEEEIEKILDWSGLIPDEGPKYGGQFGPYKQSARLEHYRHSGEDLLKKGLAYRCFCSETRLELLRRYQAKNRQRIRYDGHCKKLTYREIQEKLVENKGQCVIRFALQPSVVQFEDLIFGTVSTNFVETQESDPIIIKSDNFPTYHFANVIDDHHMQISHVLRGSEWITSTAKHIKLYEAFGWEQPKFAHFPLISMMDGSKMSKRNSQSQVKELIAQGIRPLALINFLTNMGGGVPKEKQDSSSLWDLETLVSQFDFTQIIRHPGGVDQNRLRLYNSKELQSSWNQSPDIILGQLMSILEQTYSGFNYTKLDLRHAVEPLINRISTVNEVAGDDYAYLWKMPKLTWSTEEYIQRGWDLKALILTVIKIVGELEDLNELIPKLKELAAKENLNYSELMALLRKLLTNREKGLPIVDIARQLGRRRLKLYLENGIKHLMTC